MNILMLTDNDPAGTAIEFTRAINVHTRHNCRLVTRSVRYNFDYATDIHIPDFENVSQNFSSGIDELEDGIDELEDLMKISDIFHFHMKSDENSFFGPFRPKEYMAGKMIVHHHHGHPDFRGNPSAYQDKYRKLERQNILVSTPDLMHLLPGALWQPNLVPVDDALYKPRAQKPGGPVRIAHSPTRKVLKNTRELLLAVERLIKTGLEVDLQLIENTSHVQCLALKQNSHILFDHLQGYFGVSSLEGLSQGLPVVANLDQWNREIIRNYFQTRDLPWFLSGLDTLEHDLSLLVKDADLRNQYGQNARTFMEAFWNDKALALNLVRFYEEQCR